jgi:hypothetical protein
MKRTRFTAAAVMAFTMLFTFVLTTAFPNNDSYGIEKRDYKVYPLRCNNNNLHWLDRHAAIYEAWQQMHDHGNQYGELGSERRGLKFAEKCAGLSDGCVRVTVTMFQYPTLLFKVNSLAMALQRVNDECGDRGSSVEIPGFEHVIAHMSSEWV